MKRAIIFDFFGVICTEVAPRWIEKRLPEENTEKLREDLIHPVDLGETPEAELYEELGEMAHIKAEAVSREWQELIAIDAELVSYIKELKQTYKIGLCSNAWPSFIRPILESNNLLDIFDAIVISGEVHSAKPDREIYLMTSEKLGVKNEECIFVDDNPRNVEVANELGMEGILFTSTEDFTSKLSL